MNPLLRARPHIIRALRGAAVLLALVAAGAAMLHFSEHIDWLDCVYWCAPAAPSLGRHRLESAQDAPTSRMRMRPVRWRSSACFT